MTTRNKPPVTRKGKTHKIEIGGVNVYVTLNRVEGPESLPCDIFVTLNSEHEKQAIDSAHQAWANLSMTLASLLLQYGCPLATIVAKMKDYKFDPQQPGVGSSIPDAIGRWLQTQLPGMKEGQ
jgi:hypothetical protein